MRTEFFHSRLFETPSRASLTVCMAEGTIFENCTSIISDKSSYEPDVATKSQYLISENSIWHS